MVIYLFLIYIYILIFICLESDLEFTQNSPGFPEAHSTARGGSLGCFRAVGNDEKAPLPSVNHRGQGRVGQDSLCILGNMPRLSGKSGRKPGLRNKEESN